MIDQYWVLLPNDAPFGDLECDVLCSADYDDLYAISWFTHVVPQLRGRSWYGSEMIETVQKPGEVIYVPHNMPHAILNLDENLSVTENFLGIKALDELAKYYALNWNPISHFESGWMTKGWPNLMNHIRKDDRIFLRDMYHQIRASLNGALH